MRIEKDLHIISSRYVKGKECAHISHYTDIWDNGFSVDEYSISDSGIYFEAADHVGSAQLVRTPCTRILARQFNHWVKEMVTAKHQVINIGKETILSPSSVKELRDGTYVFGIDQLCDEEEELDYDTSYFFFEIKAVNNGTLMVNKLNLTKNVFDYKENLKVTCEEDSWFSRTLSRGNVFLINSETFLRVVGVLKSLTTKLMTEVTGQVKEMSYD
jgi:hypothetical protein